MKTPSLSPPVYIKTSDDMKWPEDKFFYLLASEGLFRCRNHEFFQSCVPADKGPKGLASQDKFLRSSYPRIPKSLMEKAVGFFQLVADKQNSEAAVILVWNRTTKQMELVVPEQKGINGAPSASCPHGYPLDVKYTVPVLPPHLFQIGDIHCHVDGGAYASFTDEHDEEHRPGVHIVVGHIDKEPPQFYCAVVADGERFEANLDLVCDGYKQRNLGVPLEWLDKVKLEKGKPWSGGGTYQGTFGSYDPNREPVQSDKDIIQKILEKYTKAGTCPTLHNLTQELFRETKSATYLYCNKKADDYVDKHFKKKEKYEQPAA